MTDIRVTRILSVKREPMTAVWDEIQPLLEKHWGEIAHFEDIPLSPRKEVYAAIDIAGKLRVFTVRDGGVLVGYAVFIVDFDIHYSGSKQAKQDVMFLEPDYRRGGNGAMLISHCDIALRVEGVQVVYHHVKTAHNFGPLLGSLGYEKVESVFAKRLDVGVLDYGS